jgi:hypothetical protein
MLCFVSCASSGDNPHLETLALSLVRSGQGKPDARFFPISPRSILRCFGDCRRKPQTRSLRIRL